MKSANSRVKLPVKRGDIVIAISGEDAAAQKTGKVLQVFPETQRALVEGFNYVKKHLRKSQDNPKGGIVEKESSLHVSKLKLHTAADEKEAAAKKDWEQAALWAEQVWQYQVKAADLGLRAKTYLEQNGAKKVK